MSTRMKLLAINALVILGGGWLLTTLGFLPWFAVGIPVVVAMGMSEFEQRIKPLTFAQRHPVPTSSPTN